MSVADSRRALITYAMVGQSLDLHNDFLLGVVPIFSAIAEKRNGNQFDPAVFARDALDEFGLHIPTEVASAITPRLLKLGLVERVGNNQVAAYIWRRNTQENQENSSDISSKIDQIILKIELYVQDYPSVDEINLSRDELEDGLIQWILSEDVYIRGAMKALGRGGSELDNKSRQGKSVPFLIAWCIGKMAESNEFEITLISEISNAVVVSEAILGVAYPNQDKVKSTDLIAYLDSPFMMDLIGLSGKARSEYCREIVNSLKSVGVRVQIFQHYVEELVDNLKGLLAAPTRYGLTADALRRGEVKEPYIHHVINNVEQVISEYKVPIYDIEKTPLAINSKAYFSPELRDDLMHRMTSMYEKNKALERDLLSIEIVMRRRQGHKSQDFFKSKFSFIINNSELAAVCSRLLRETGGHDGQIPVAVTGKNVATVVWLQFGNNDRKEIARKRLISSCSDVLRVNPTIIEQIKNRLSQIDEESSWQFEQMMSQSRYMQMAMSLTFANEDVASTVDVAKVLEVLKADLVSEEREKARLREAELVGAHKGELDSVIGKVDAMKVDNASLRDGLSKMQWSRDELIRSAISADIVKLRRRYNWITYGSATMIVATLLSWTVLSYYFNMTSWSYFGNAVFWLSVLVTVLVTVMSFAGVGIHWMFRRLKRRYEGRIIRTAKEKLGVSISSIDLASDDFQFGVDG